MYASTVAGIFVKAVMAAYLPPLACLPQIVITMKRAPRSRAVFAATENLVRQGGSRGKLQEHLQPTGANAHTATALYEDHLSRMK